MVASLLEKLRQGAQKTTKGGDMPEDASPSINQVNQWTQSTHPFEKSETFYSIEEYIIHLMHRRSYEEACRLAKGKAVLDWGCNTGWGIEILETGATEIAGQYYPCAGDH